MPFETKAVGRTDGIEGVNTFKPVASQSCLMVALEWMGWNGMG